MSIRNYFKILPYLIIISAFGVYIGFGLRMEHLVIYPSALLLLLGSIGKRHLMIKNYFNIFIMWFFVAITALIVSVSSNVGNVQISKIISDAESFIQPLALMVLFLFLNLKYTEKDVSDKLTKSSQVLLLMLSLNTVFIFVSMFTDVSQISSLFWGSEDHSVASLAMTNGRYSGVFNQPMEAGVMYSIGLLAWLYLSEKIEVLNLKYVLALFLMIVGGLVTVSKVFIFGGLPLFAVGVLLNKKIWKMVFSLSFWSFTLGYAAYYFLLKSWSGFDYLIRFFGSHQGLLILLTAGRLGGLDSQQSGYFKGVWNESPIIGRGFGSTPIYDSGYFYFFAVGGIIGLVTGLVILSTLLFIGFRLVKQNKLNAESKLYMFIVILIIGSSIGVPVLTLNRVSAVLWVFLGLLFQFYYFEKVRINQETVLIVKK